MTPWRLGDRPLFKWSVPFAIALLSAAAALVTLHVTGALRTDRDLEGELRAHLDAQPRDARGWVMYARLQAERDRFDEAAQAYERAIALSSRVARDPAVWCEYADALGMARGGRLEGRPRELIDRALALDSRHPKALEMAGSSEHEQGRYAAALGFWRPLLEQLRPGTRRHDELAAAIARTERLAGAPPAGGPLSFSSTRAR